MTTPTPEPSNQVEAPSQANDGQPEIAAQPIDANKNDEGRRRVLLILLLVLLVLCCGAGYFIISYLAKPQPLPEMMPLVNQSVNYPPTYKFSFKLDEPAAVAVSPDGQRIYALESTGERLVKMFNRDGALVKSFAPPLTTSSNRKLTYVAVDAGGRVFVTDMYNSQIVIFDQDGNFIDAIIGQDKTISEIISAHTGGTIPTGALFTFDKPSMSIKYEFPGEPNKSIQGVKQDDWAPVGLRFDRKGDLLVTNFVGGKHEVLIFPADALSGSWLDFSPKLKRFGEQGSGDGQFSFPNSVVTDSKGNFYVSDGNNGRISVWTPDLKYHKFFGFGSTENTLNLPRGMWMDVKDHLHVADTVGELIRVYDVSAAEPAFLYSFGVFGNQEGEFNAPNDICIDGTGRLYIADRKNNRIQVWSY